MVTDPTLPDPRFTDRMQPGDLLRGYDTGPLALAVLGSHSALEVAFGARAEAMRTIVVCQRGRDATYSRHFRNLFDDVILLDRFSDICAPEVVERLRSQRAVFVPNRSFATYVGYDAIEQRFPVPLFGSRQLLRAEERDAAPNQFDLLDAAGIRTPKRFASPAEIDRLVMVKLPHATKRVERGFFTVSSPEEFAQFAEEQVRHGRLRADDLQTAIIEEFVVGAQFNLDYFFAPVSGDVEFLGADQRIETSIDGVVRMTAHEQFATHVVPTLLPVGHQGVTVRESLLDQVFDLGERLAAAARQRVPPGILGCFALQGVFLESLEFCVFDVSLRVPGAPIVQTTSPYSRYRHGQELSIGRRIAMELADAVRQGVLDRCIT